MHGSRRRRGKHACRGGTREEAGQGPPDARHGAGPALPPGALPHMGAESGGRAGEAAAPSSPLFSSLSPSVRRSNSRARSAAATICTLLVPVGEALHQSREVGHGHDLHSFRAEQERPRERRLGGRRLGGGGTRAGIGPRVHPAWFCLLRARANGEGRR